jgi:hypothetical protein
MNIRLISATRGLSVSIGSMPIEAYYNFYVIEFIIYYSGLSGKFPAIEF